jgi:hypothetical protein
MSAESAVDATLAGETSFWCSLLERHDSILDAYAFFQQQSSTSDDDESASKATPERSSRSVSCLTKSSESKGPQTTSGKTRSRSSSEHGFFRRGQMPEDTHGISMLQLNRGIERLECWGVTTAPQQSQDIFNKFGGKAGHLSQGDFIAALSRWQALKLPSDLAAMRLSALKRFRAPPRPQGDSVRS